MTWDHFLRVKIGRSRRYLAASRYAITFALYRLFEHDPEPKAALAQSGRRFSDKIMLQK
jgi:hypothetical protein